MLFYNRNLPQYGGAYSYDLVAVTDQAIVSEQTLLVSDNITFRHIHKYLDYFPNIGIKEAISKNKNGVLQMSNDWSSENFLKRFEQILFL